MDAVLLAGGYATRLYPLTKDRPKALLPIGDKTILDYNLDVLAAYSGIERFFLVTNSRFYTIFQNWAAQRPASAKTVEILDDGTDSNENRLGAIGDIKFALDNAPIDRSDFLYVAGTDNIADFDITQIAAFAKKRDSTAVFAYEFPCPDQLSTKGVAVVGEEGKITRFVEKSNNPPSHLVVPPYYVYHPDAVDAIEQYLQEGNNHDAPGHFLSWLVEHYKVYAVVTDQVVRDIGNLESYQKVAAEKTTQ